MSKSPSNNNTEMDAIDQEIQSIKREMETNTNQFQDEREYST